MNSANALRDCLPNPKSASRSSFGNEAARRLEAFQRAFQRSVSPQKRCALPSRRRFKTIVAVRPNTDLQAFTVLPEPVMPFFSFPVCVVHEHIYTNLHAQPPIRWNQRDSTLFAGCDPLFPCIDQVSWHRFTKLGGPTLTPDSPSSVIYIKLDIITDFRE